MSMAEPQMNEVDAMTTQKSPLSKWDLEGL